MAAKKLTPEAAAETKKNSAARDAIIKSVANNIMSLDAQISELNAKRRKERARIKELDMKLADFDAQFRLMKIEDEEERQRSIETQREIFNALSIGEQGSFLYATEAN